MIRIIFWGITLFLLLSGVCISTLQAGDLEIDSLKKDLENPEIVYKVGVLNELAWEYLDRDLREAHLYAQRAVDLADRNINLKDYGDSRMRLGSVLIKQEKAEKAIPLFEEAVEVRRQLRARAQTDDQFYAAINLAGAYDNLAIAYSMNLDFQNSVRNEALAIELLKPHQDIPAVSYMIASFYNNRADGFQKYDRFVEALAACDSAKILLQNLDASADFERGRNLLIDAQIHMDLAQCDDAKSKLDQAAPLLHQYPEEEFYILHLTVKEGIVAKCEGKIVEALEKLYGVYPKAKQLGQTDIIHTINDQLIEIYLQLNEKDSVRKILARYGSLSLSDSDKLNVTNNYLNLIELSLAEEDTTQAVELFGQIEDVIQRDIPVAFKNRYALLKSKYYHMKGNFVEAYKYSSLSKKFSDTLFSDNFKAQDYNRAIEDRDRIQAEKETQSRIDFLIMLSLAIVVILLALSILFMNRSFKERNRALGAITQQTRLEQKVDTLIKENEISSLNSLIQGQEKERERIGRELHDGVVATLSTVKLYINGINDHMNLVAKETNSKIVAANQLIDSALEEVRSISHNLSKGMLTKLGLKDALHNFGDIIQNAGQAEIAINVYDMDERAHVETELMIYRNIQELVGNAIKHGGASKIEIGVTKYDESINVIVQDDGRGFDYESIKKEGKGGIGLYNMEQTIVNLKGQFDVDSSPGTGTTIIMEIPIKYQKESAQS